MHEISIILWLKIDLKKKIFKRIRSSSWLTRVNEIVWSSVIVVQWTVQPTYQGTVGPIKLWNRKTTFSLKL